MKTNREILDELYYVDDKGKPITCRGKHLECVIEGREHSSTREVFECLHCFDAFVEHRRKKIRNQ